MNIHHLELFYYVARHGGISSAVRQIPYGIQQPAVSSQVLLLEQDLGAKLFERKPFRLTPKGLELYNFVRPFFEGLDKMSQHLRETSTPLLRLGAAEFVLRDYLPAVIKRLKAKYHNLQLGLRAGFTPEMERWLAAGEIDLAITPWEGKPPAKLSYVRLVNRPLALLVPKASKIRSVQELWQQDRIDMPLIRLPETETITRIFLRGLKKLRVDWPLCIEASSVDLVVRYVANGYGYGLTVDVPEIVESPQVRLLPLAGFPPIELLGIWRGEGSPLVHSLIEEIKILVAQRWPDWKCS